MKKYVITILLFMIMLIPLNIRAASIRDTSISGTTIATTGTEYSIFFNISFSDIQKGSADSLGILLVGYELTFDEDVFIITGVSSNEWDSIVYKEDGKYYILSEVGENDPFKNKCADGILYCSDYGVLINFYVKDTDKTSTQIKMNEIEVALLEMIKPNKEYGEDDIIEIEGTSDKVQTITIKKSESPKSEEPKEIVDNSKPTINPNQIISEDKKNVEKSNNKYLKSLKIEEYKLEFDKNKNNYEIKVGTDVNKLKLDIELEDEKSTYKIIGADDLKANNYKVLIEVTAENGDKNTYTINVKQEEPKKEAISKKEFNGKEKKEYKLNKKIIIVGIIVLSLLIIIGIVMAIISHRNSKKIDKAFEEL